MRPSFPLKIFLALACAALLAGCGSSGRSDLASSAAGELAPPRIDRVETAQRAEYRLSPDDVIDITVYQVPDLTRTAQVDGGGRIMLPLLGVMQASGKTVRELEVELIKRLGERYLQSPQVAVFLKESSGQKVVVEGDVKSPGVVQARGYTTLLAAVASVGGFTDTADLSAVYVIRQTEQGRMSARFNAEAIRSGSTADPQIYGGDTIVVDGSSGKLAWKYFRETLPAVGVFRFLLP